MNLSTELLTQVFENGQLPHLVYANCQNYGQQKHDRPMHSHDHFCELLLCYRGFGTYNIGRHSYPIQEGDLIYYNAGELHEVVSTSDVEIGTYCFGFANVHFHGMPHGQFIPPDSPHVRPSESAFPFLCSLANQILELYTGDARDQLTVQLLAASLLLMAAQTSTSPQEDRITDAASQLTARIKEYIDTHYTEPLSLEDIAQALSCSVPHVAHTFKKTTGYSPIQYAIRRRIGMAQTLLISSDYSATHIATLVGYDNTNYFNSLFTKIVGTTPIRYRKQYLESLRGDRDQL